MTFGDLPRKPNLLLIVTDQEREVMHWPAGWAEANLPARSRLLANGLQFTRAQCNTAACSSSRATFFTGLYPAQHGVKNLIACDDPKDEAQRRLPILPSRLPNLATVMAAAGYHVVLKGKFHLSRPVQYNHEMRRHYWSEADVQHIAERYGFHGWNPPDMSDPQSLSDLGGGAINNDGRFVDGSGTAAGKARPLDELHRESAVHFLNTYDGAKPFCLIVALVNPHDVQEYPGRGLRGISVSPTFAKGGYRLEDFQDLPIDLPANVEDDLSTKPSVHASFRQLLAIGTGHVKTRERQLMYEMYDLKRDPLELTNLAHATHGTPASDLERTRLHRRLTEVMRVNGTMPDEIRWPAVDDFTPSTRITVAGEDEETQELETQELR